MPMIVKYNPRQLEVNLEQIGERAMRGMSERMRVVAREIRDLARDYAPVKTGLLEKSIDYMTVRKGGRNAYVVFIDLDASRYKGNGQVGEYAYIMEEELHPYGRQRGSRRLTLGALSMAKAAGGRKVGGRFLARAVKEGTRGLLEIMAGEVRRSMGGSRTANVQFQRSSDNGDDE